MLRIAWNIDIPAEPLADALMQLSRQANVNIVADGSLTPAPEQAFLWLAIGMMYGERVRRATS